MIAARIGEPNAGATGLNLQTGLFVWWQRQIEALLPHWARPAPRDAVIIDILTFSRDPHAATPATGRILLRRSGHEGPATQLDFSRPSRIETAASDAVILRLPREMVLRREMTLPQAAEGDLRSLIHFQMHRLTPFDADEVFWEISQPVREQTQLKLTLHVVQRQLVAPLLALLAATGLEPSILQDGEIPLARLGHRPAPRRNARLGICAALAVACLAIPVISQQMRLAITGHRLEMLLPAQQQIMQLHAQIAAISKAQSLIGQTQNTDILHTLALLSRALPNGTWLNDLTVTDGTVSFDGQSNDAAGLISTLAATPGLQNVGFTAPVTRAPGGADAFSIQLSVAR